MSIPCRDHMYKPPFIRRLLPWLYALVFFALGPLLVLYTAGYTYNVKKRMVERNGVLIVDGTPKGARIWLDGTDTGKTIPYTFQTLAPGWHTVTVEKNGYSRWEKRLNILTEQVAFANQVRLWAIRQPTLLLTKDVSHLTNTEDGTWITTLTQKTTGLEIGRLRPGKPILYETRSVSSTDPLTVQSVRWNKDGTSFVLNGIDNTQASYWGTIDPDLQLNQLPKGLYDWVTDETLLGSDDIAMTRLQTASNRLSREQLPPTTVFQDAEFLLQTTGTPPVLLLTKRSLQDKIYQLPQIDWRPIARFSPLIILKDRHRSHWMALDPSQTKAYAGDIWGDFPRWNTTNNEKEPSGLFLNGGEAWIWQPKHDPMLIWRQAEPLIGAAWDPNGGQIILSDKTHIFSVGLDERDGRQTTTLDTFDDIQSFTLFNKRLYISARQGTEQGIWERILE